MRPALVALVLATLPAPALAGYTHSWTWKKSPDRTRLKQCVADMKRVLAASPVQLAGPEGSGKPSLTDDFIAFNQAGPDDKIGEPFIFPGLGGGTRGHCKTNGLPYDSTVVACLLVVMDHFTREDIDITSDGKLTEGAWDEGIALYKKVFHRDPKLSKDGGFGEVFNNINLRPSWGVERFFLMLGLMALAAGVLWFFLNPRPHFVILAGTEHETSFRGKFPEMYANAVREFFQKDVQGPRSVTVKGWNEPGGRFRLTFTGDISDKDQQRVRNFFGMLRKR